MKLLRKTEGFSLVEILIVIAIIGILSAVVVPSFISGMPTRRLKSAARDLYGAMQQARLLAVKNNQNYTLIFDEEEVEEEGVVRVKQFYYLDEDDDGEWDPQDEPFTDENDNKTYDLYLNESFTDENGNGTYDLGEPFTDENDNGTYDLYPSELINDRNGNGKYDPGEDDPFDDKNHNDKYDLDPGEPFTDSDENGRYSFAERRTDLSKFNREAKLNNADVEYGRGTVSTNPVGAHNSSIVSIGSPISITFTPAGTAEFSPDPTSGDNTIYLQNEDNPSGSFAVSVQSSGASKISRFAGQGDWE
ncbi:MAG: prepilin-type N-terminal cleavage/methylation domain-containing protein [Candidatus Electrothrix sp. GM3_4]|nr:prepilin-type N-terminal cleavage/methylation domain-containing protein [Candidatus Electrothrix sp. GM3_4]